jgi:hypothetical protein
MSHQSSTVRVDGFLQELRKGARIRESLARSARFFRIRANAADATSEGSNRGRVGLLSKASTFALVAITLAYLVVEVLWNIQLLETMSKASATRAEVEAMVSHGRWLAAFGLVWALLRSMLFSRKSGVDGVVNWVLFGSAIVIAYASIGTMYGKAIDSLSPATSMQAFELAAHRSWALKDDLEPERQARVAAAVKDAPAVALWGLYVADRTVAGDANAEYMARRNGLSQDSVSAALAKYPEIEAARKKLAAGGDRMAKFDQRYEEYLAKSRKVEGVTFQWVKRDAIKQFADATCGMLPNAHASKADFARELTKSCVNDWRKAGQAYLDNALAANSDLVVYDNHGIRVRLSEVINLNEQQFTALVRDKASGLVDEQLPAVETVKSNERAHDVIASVIVPPMSMVLSMLGIVANLGGVAALVVGLKRFQGIASMLALAGAALLTPASSPKGMPQAWKAFSAEHGALAFVASKVVSAERFLLSAKGTW